LGREGWSFSQFRTTGASCAGFFRPFAAWQIQSRSLFPTFPASVWHKDAYTGFTYRVIDASNPPRSGLFLP